jgi:hypothetical protein
MGWTDELWGKVVSVEERGDGITRYFVSDVVTEVCVSVSTATIDLEPDLARVRARGRHAYGRGF